MHPSINTSMILYEGALGSILGTLILDTFFSNEIHAKWVLLAAMTEHDVSYKYKKLSGLQVETTL
jgi:hypothetical protein